MRHMSLHTHCACRHVCSALLQLAQLQAELVAKQAMLGNMCSQLSSTQQQLAAFDDTSSAALQQLQQQLADATAARQELQLQLDQALQEQQQQLTDPAAATDDTLQAPQQQQQQQGSGAVDFITEQSGGPLSPRSPFSSREPRPASGTPAGSRQELAQLVRVWMVLCRLGLHGHMAVQLCLVGFCAAMRCRGLLCDYVLLLIGVLSWLLAVSSREPRFAHGTPAGSRQELAQLVGTFCIEDESQPTQSLSDSLLSCALQRNATHSMFAPPVLCFVYMTCTGGGAEPAAVDCGGAAQGSYAPTISTLNLLSNLSRLLLLSCRWRC
jgi:hypothetical protein